MERITDERMLRYHTILEDGKTSLSIRACKEILYNLLEERKQPKVWENVWKSADKCVNRAIVHYVSADGRDYGAIEFHRELPKSPEREIAERMVSLNRIGDINTVSSSFIEQIIVDGINTYKALKA
jgi:hypothetical protein